MFIGLRIEGFSVSEVSGFAIIRLSTYCCSRGVAKNRGNYCAAYRASV